MNVLRTQNQTFRTSCSTKLAHFMSKRKSISSSSLSVGEKAFYLRRGYEELGKRRKPATVLAQAGIMKEYKNDGIELNSNIPMSPSIELSTTYERPASGVYHSKDLIYTRERNPTRMLLESTMVELEGLSKEKEESQCIAFSSGQSAVSALLLSSPNSTVILPNDLYHGVPSVLCEILQKHNINYVMTDMTNLSTLEELLEEKLSNKNGGRILIWIESPSNPLMKITDIAQVCQIARKKEHECIQDILVIVDSTVAPPPISQPLLLGVDAVMHSATKYLGGHCDVLLGVVTVSHKTKHGETLGKELRKIQQLVGSVASPFESWLTLRGLRTLHVRLERACENAQAIACFLQSHALVTKVHYPGLDNEDDAQHQLLKKQMKYNGAMLSFELDSEEMAMAVAGAVSVIHRATSLGGTETLIEHRASIEPEERRISPPGLLRLSVGIEDVKDVIDDLNVALDIANRLVNETKT